jgi:hypothetical protein
MSNPTNIAPAYLNQAQLIQRNYQDISNNLTMYYQNRDKMYSKMQYDYSGNSLQLFHNTIPTINDGLKEDTDTLILRENTLFIVGSITMASLIVLALIIGSK